MKRRIVFLCGRNDSLSSMAAAFLSHVDSRNFEVFSSDVNGREAHPLAVEVMNEILIPPAPQKPIEAFHGEVIDFLITMDEAGARHSQNVMARETVNWKFENPLAASDDPRLQRRAFRSVRDQIAQRVRLFAIVHARSERVGTMQAARATTAIS